MDPIWILLGTFVALHVIEGALWVRRDAFVFEQMRRRWLRCGTTSPLGSTHRVFIFGGPLPPFRALTVVESWPFFFGDARVFNVALSTLARNSDVPAMSIDREQAKQARVESSDVWIGRTLFAKTSSSTFAVILVDALRNWDAKAVKKYDVAWCRERLEQHRRAVRVLKWFAWPLPFVLFAGLAALFLSHAAFLVWPIVLGVMIAWWWVTCLLFFRQYRRLYPRQKGDAWLKLLLFVASPLSAARAVAWLGRDLFAGAHPLMVASVLLDDDAFRELAGLFLRDARFPLDRENARVIPADRIAAARAKFLSELEAIAASRAVTSAELQQPPPRTPETLTSYCPRCHQVYAHGDGPCPDCPGVERLRWPTSLQGAAP